MKKITSIIFIAFILLAGHHASGQESGGLINGEKGSLPQSHVTTDSTQDPCGSLFSAGYIYQSEGTEPQGYDTLRAFMEQCPFYLNAAKGFNMLQGAVSQWGNGGPGRWPVFMSWLKKVLYYNPDTEWYCDDVSVMLGAAQSDQTVELICQYMLQSNKCPYFNSYFQQTLTAVIQDRHQAWFDSLKHNFDTAAANIATSSYYWPDSINADTLAHPFTDTTVPTLFQDSLEILLGPQYAGVQPIEAATGQALLSAQLIDNPLKKDEIDISFDMGREALVTMQLYDVLGKSIPIANAKYQLEQPGNHDASIPAQSLPRGTYYLRISTDTGDAITLKLLKE